MADHREHSPEDLDSASGASAEATAVDGRVLFDETGRLSPAVLAKLDSLPPPTPRATYQSLLTLPADFIASAVRNACEVRLLLEIGQCGFKLEQLIHCELDRAGCELAIGKRYWTLQSVCPTAAGDGNANEYESLLPILDVALQKLGRQRVHILTQLEACAEQLEQHRRACAQFAEMNAGMAAEVARAGVPGLALEKYILADVQWEMVCRIDAITQGRSMPAAADVEWPALIQRFRVKRGDDQVPRFNIPSHITDTLQSDRKRKRCDNVSLDLEGSSRQPPAKKADILHDVSKSSSSSDRSPLIITQINAKSRFRLPPDAMPDAMPEVTASCLLTSTPLASDHIHQTNFVGLSGVSTASQHYGVRDTPGSSPPSAAPADPAQNGLHDQSRRNLDSPEGDVGTPQVEVETEHEHSQISTQPMIEGNQTSATAAARKGELRDQLRDHSDADDNYENVLVEETSEEPGTGRSFAATCDVSHSMVSIQIPARHGDPLQPSPELASRHPSPPLSADSSKNPRAPHSQYSERDNVDDNDDESCNPTQDSYLAVRYAERVTSSLRRAHRFPITQAVDGREIDASSVHQKAHDDNAQISDTDKENDSTPANPYRGPTLSLSSSPASGSRVLRESGSQDASQDGLTVLTSQRRRSLTLTSSLHRRMEAGEEADESLTEEERASGMPASAVSLNLSTSSGVSSQASGGAQEEGVHPQALPTDENGEQGRVSHDSKPADRAV
ncbi:hypothetical protein HDU86_005130 [Geranomyces michiganensis]|nr:hypothetical protein HDU86_005130 [Geranomyces michiganensis]